MGRNVQPGAWTLATATAALPQVRQLLAEGRKFATAAREAAEQLDDLRIVHGDGVLAVASPGHAEFLEHHAAFQAASEGLGRVLAAFQALGVEVKDIDQGLVDFRGRVGADEAYLCWKDPEPTIGWWHPLEGGFAARRRLL